MLKTGQLTNTPTIWAHRAQVVAVGALDDQLRPPGILRGALRRQLGADLVEAVGGEALDNLCLSGRVEELESDGERYEVDVTDVDK